MELLQYILIADVILSWFSLSGVSIRPKFFADILDPIYRNIRHYIPTRFWAFDFTPIFLFLFIYFCRGLIYTIFPEIWLEIQSFL